MRRMRGMRMVTMMRSRTSSATICITQYALYGDVIGKHVIGSHRARGGGPEETKSIGAGAAACGDEDGGRRRCQLRCGGDCP